MVRLKILLPKKINIFTHELNTMANHNKLGVKGEQIALDYLRKKGHQIIEANWRAHKYEIDIISIDKDEVVFVEVKTRKTNFFGNPEEAVTLKKQEHLINGADFYINQNEIDLESRFDVIAIVLDENELEVKHIKNAFYPEV